MKLVVSVSLYDSASSRAQALQAGAAEKSIRSGLFWDLAASSAASMFLNQLTSIVHLNPFAHLFPESVNLIMRQERSFENMGQSLLSVCKNSSTSRRFGSNASGVQARSSSCE